MKKITDTFCALDGKKWAISSNTQILCPDPIAAEQILSCCEQPSQQELETVCVHPLDDQIIGRARRAFGFTQMPPKDSYILENREGQLRIYADTPNGIRYAACAIRSHYHGGIGEGLLCNMPLAPFRAMKVYIPARENIPFFRQFVKMCMYYGYNTLIMEVGGAMEYKRHPEINKGWEEYADIFREYPGKADDVQRCMPWLKDSIHWENGGGSYLPQTQLRELIDYCEAHGLEVIPEVPSLSHSDYLLTRHPELAENPDDPVPDTYCPSNEAVYDLLFDVLEEVLEVFRPKTVHIAHDEWYTACLCARCREKDPGALFAADVNRIHRWLKARGVGSMIWGDMLFSFLDRFGNLRGSGIQVRKILLDRTVTIRGKQYPARREIWGKTALETQEGILYQAPQSQSALELVDKDVVIMHWMHTHQPTTDDVYHAAGFTTVYGNFVPRNFDRWFRRMEKGVQGIAISNWSMLDSRHMQRNGIFYHMVYAAMMLWNRDFREENYQNNTLAVARELFDYRHRETESYAEIVHAATVVIPHRQFVDGCCMDEDADRMGYYRIDYADGTSERLDIFWGLNIGILTPWEPRAKELGYHEMNFLEPTYTCDYVIAGNETWYRLLIPLKKGAVAIVPEVFEQYTDAVKIHSIRIVNNEERAL